MRRFPRVEAFRAEQRASPFTRLDAAALAHLRERYADAHHSNAIDVPGYYATPVLHTAEGILDAMTLPIEDLIVGQGNLSVFVRRNAGLNSAGAQPFPEPVAVASTIAEQLALWREHRKQESGALVVVHLPFGEHHDDRSAVPVADGMQLGVQAAFDPSNATRSTPFLSRLAAVR